MFIPRSKRTKNNKAQYDFIRCSSYCCWLLCLLINIIFLLWNCRFSFTVSTQFTNEFMPNEFGYINIIDSALAHGPSPQLIPIQIFACVCLYVYLRVSMCLRFENPKIEPKYSMPNHMICSRLRCEFSTSIVSKQQERNRDSSKWKNYHKCVR